MVDLEEVTEAEEAIELKGRIERHLEYTGSASAKAVLADWKKSLTKFVKVMPRDYKRAMAELRAVSGLRDLQSRIRRRSRAKLSDREVRSAIEKGRS
jgi:glutamate synthase domain-containing protein 3